MSSDVSVGLMGSSTTTETCCHHWQIERASGRPTSPGVCQLCGAERQFQNSIESDRYGQHPDRITRKADEPGEVE